MSDDESARFPIGSVIAEQDSVIDPDQVEIETLLFDGPLPGGYLVSHPIEIHVWIEAGEFVADTPELNLHSFGEDRGAAIGNLAQLIVSHDERLERLGDKLSRRMIKDRDRLRIALCSPGASLG